MARDNCISTRGAFEVGVGASDHSERGVLTAELAASIREVRGSIVSWNGVDALGLIGECGVRWSRDSVAAQAAANGFTQDDNSMLQFDVLKIIVQISEFQST